MDGLTELPSTVEVAGGSVPNGYRDEAGRWHTVPCTCPRDPADGTYIERAEDCPYHGRAPYMVCSLCNYDRHECGGCGAPREHGQGACDECAAELAEEQRRAREGV